MAMLWIRQTLRGQGPALMGLSGYKCAEECKLAQSASRERGWVLVEGLGKVLNSES